MNKISKVPREHVFGENGFPLDVSTWKEHGDYPLHTHDFSEIAIVLEGSGTTEVDGNSFDFRAGDVFVLHGKRPHAYQNTHDLTLINITYDPKAIAMDRLDPGELPGYQALFMIAPTIKSKEAYQRHLTLTLNQMIQVKALTDVMEKELHERHPGCQLMAVGHFFILVTFLARCYMKTEAPNAQKVLQLGYAISYLEKHCMEEVNVDDLARIAHMARRSFFRAFSEVTRQTPLAYLLRLRIMKAVEMLELTDKTITEITFDCGFQDSNYFSRQFKKVMGLTPSVFKKKYNRRK